MIKLNYIFFLVIISFTLSIIFIPVSAQTIEHGRTFDRELLAVNPDGKTIYKWTAKPARILDDNWVYHDYIFSDLPNVLIVETSHGTVTLDKTTCGFSFHKQGLIRNNPTPLFTDNIILKMASDGLEDWQVIDVINAAPCIASWNGQALIATKQVTNIGVLEYKYIKQGFNWKAQLEVTNLSNNSNKKFGFTQTIDLNRDNIKFGGVTRNLDNFDGFVFNRTFLENNKAKVLNLLNGVTFDFDLGFDNLESISVFNTGTNKSKLVFDYTRNTKVILSGETFIVDPTFTSDSPTKDTWIGDEDNDNVCEDTGSTTYTESPSSIALWSMTYATSGTEDCIRSWSQFDTGSIPSDATFLSGQLDLDVAVLSSTEDHRLYLVTSQDLTTRTPEQAFDEIDDDTLLQTYTVSSTGEKIITFDSGDLTALEAEHQANEYLTFGFRIDDETLTASQRGFRWDSAEGTTPMELSITYEVLNLPNAVTDLSLVVATLSTLEIEWTEPNLNGGTLSGYQVNVTTPQTNDPTDVYVNDTGTTTNSITITSLDFAEDYSIRISPWTENGNNASGTVLNATTLALVGDFSVNQTNPDLATIIYDRTILNDTSNQIDVRFLNDYDNFNCRLDFELAQITKNYYNVSSVVYDSNYNYSSFVLVNSTNDIIHFHCWDLDSGDEAKYILTLTNIPFIDQVQGFQGGDYGTEGDFGVLDLTTIIIVIASMVGLNRVNETAGVIIGFMILFGLAFFELITIPTLLFGGIAIVIMLVITTTRKP